MTDEELVERIAREDAGAIRELYRRHGRIVYGIALGICGDQSTAEEVVQDAFVRVWKNANRYRSDQARVVTWIARIARNAAIDALRSSSSRAQRIQSADVALERVLDPRGADPADSAQWSERRERVRAAVTQLPPEQRRALLLAFYRGLTHREISELLAMPLGSVKTHIRDAVRSLRGSLAEEWP